MKPNARRDDGPAGAPAGGEAAEPLGERVLVVDDEPNIRTVLCELLRREGWTAVEAAGGAEAIEMLRRAPFSAVVSDLRMPGLDGLDLVSRAAEEFPGLPVVLLTAHGTVETAVQALRRGAFDFLTKPFDRDEVRAVVRKALATGSHAFRESGSAGGERSLRMVGDSPSMQEVYRLIGKVAALDAPVLILGESGTGKELVARAIHEGSPGQAEAFIKVNCAAIPPTLAESELFGHEKGAFSGAAAARPGRFELADGGTLFLDEVGEMPLEVQPKLLRALQDGEVERVGGTSSRRVKVRLVAATNLDLSRAVAEKRFREDLFFRLNVFPIRLPPLRERREDIPPLAERFLARVGRKLGRELQGLSPALMEMVKAQRFPGNVRELENLIERMAILASGSLLDVGDLPPEYRAGGAGADAAAAPAPAPPGGDRCLKEEVRRAVEAVERNSILRALAQTDWNVTHAAERLGLSRKGLQLKMRDYDLRRKEA